MNNWWKYLITGLVTGGAGYLAGWLVTKKIERAKCDEEVKSLVSTLTSKKLLDKYLKDVLTNIPGGYWEKIEKLHQTSNSFSTRKTLRRFAKKPLNEPNQFWGKLPQ